MTSDAHLVAPGATLGVKFRYLAQSPVTDSRQSHRDCHSPQLAGQRTSSLTGANLQASVCSAISKASSTSMPRYRTVLSNLV
jgi:hypothetical protein